MKKLIFLLLALGSLQSFGQVSKSEVNTLIDAKLTNSVRPSDIKAVAKKLSDFANQGDSTAKTKESFIVPGSSAAYWNGLKQWIPFPDLSIYSQNGHTHAWSVITGKPTTVATSGLTDAVSLAGSQALTGKTIAGASNTITLTSAQITGPLGYTPVNPSSTPSLVPTSNDVQSVGGGFNYFANGYIRQLNLNSTASINGATNGKISFTGILKGDGAELTNIPYTALTGTPTIPTNADYVDRSTTQNVPFVKTFTDTWANYQIKVGATGQAGIIGFNRGTDGASVASIGYNDATSLSDFRINSGTGNFSLFSNGNRRFQLFPSGNSAFQAAGAITDSGHLVQINGTSNHTGTATFRANHGSFQADFGQINEGARLSFRAGLDGSQSGVIGYETSVSNEFQFRAGSQSSFTNAGNRTVTMFADGNILAQTGGTPANAGYKFDVIGTSRLSGTATTQLLIPSANVTYDVGSLTARYANVWTGQVVTPGALSLGSTVVNNAITFRQGSATQISGGFHTSGKYFLQNSVAMPTDNGAGLQVSHDITASAGKAWGQTFTPILRAAANNDELIGTVIAPALIPGAFTGVTSYALRVGSDMKMDGKIDLGGNVMPQADNIYALGSISNRFTAAYSAAFFSGSFINPSGNITFGAASASANIDVRQGITNQLVTGWFPSGNMWIQPRGARPSDTGELLQVKGGSSFSGEFKNTVGVAGAGLKTASVLGGDFISIHHVADTPSANNFIIGATQAGSGTFIGAVGSISSYINGSMKQRVNNEETQTYNLVNFQNVPVYADNAAAIADGQPVGRVYRTGDLLKIVH